MNISQDNYSQRLDWYNNYIPPNHDTSGYSSRPEIYVPNNDMFIQNQAKPRSSRTDNRASLDYYNIDPTRCAAPNHEPYDLKLDEYINSMQKFISPQSTEHVRGTNYCASTTTKEVDARHDLHYTQLDCTLSDADYISIKSKIGVEFRRYALKRDDVRSFDNLYKKIESFHQLSAIPFVIFYTDPEDFILPINNDDNLAKAIRSAKHITLRNKPSGNDNNDNQNATFERPYLKIFIEKKGVFLDYQSGSMSGKVKKNQHLKGLSNFILPANNDQGMRPSIGMPEDFRQVSSIIDVDILPLERRRVVLKRGGSEKPLGFYIRDGTYHRMNAQGIVEKHYGIFISRLVPGGLAESTNLLAENDEILEVNGIEVGKNKRLDQVRDMMVANSSNLIITTRPATCDGNPYSHYNRMRGRVAYTPRERLPSNRSTGSDLAEDYIRHHIY